jgi:hypothetical protein
MLYHPETVCFGHAFYLFQGIFFRKFRPYQLIPVEIVAFVGVPHVDFLRHQAHEVASYFAIDGIVMRVKVELVGFECPAQLPVDPV